MWFLVFLQMESKEAYISVHLEESSQSEGEKQSDLDKSQNEAKHFTHIFQPRRRINLDPTTPQLRISRE
jgi:hypothetical protein